jgi:putative ABC transport system substrate-binding protein
MNRRTFITLLGGAASWPLAARAQQPGKVRRIGVLIALAQSDPETKAWVAGFLQARRDLCNANAGCRRAAA